MPDVHWPSYLRQIHALEQSWNTFKVDYPRGDAVPFLPLPIPQFIVLLADAVMAAPVSWDVNGPKPVRFLDAGCGTGTKALLAQKLFGLESYGIDIVPAFIAEARASGLRADVIDAFDFGSSYSTFGIVFANRPSTLQDELEPLITEAMAPGAVLMAANWRHSPAEYGFEIVTMEIERPVHGVFRKPQS